MTPLRHSNVAARAGKSNSGNIGRSRKVVYVSDETIHMKYLLMYINYIHHVTRNDRSYRCPYGGIKKFVHHITPWMYMILSRNTGKTRRFYVIYMF